MPEVLPRLDPSRIAALRWPYDVYAEYREHDWVHQGDGLGDGLPPTWYVFRYEDVAQVLSSLPVGRSTEAAKERGRGPVPSGYPTLSAVIGGFMLRQDPPQHTRLRSAVGKALAPAAIRRVRPYIADVAEALATEVEQKPKFDAVAEFARPLPIRVLSRLMGLPQQDASWLRTETDTLMAATPSRRTPHDAALERAEAAAARLVEYFRAVIAKRCKHSTDDLIGAMVRSGELTDDEVVVCCIQLLSADGNLALLIANALLALLERPDVVSDLRANPDLLTSAVEELIRFDAPDQAIGRVAYEDIEIGDRRIARGERLALMLGSANHDPRRYSSPVTLDIRRRVGKHCGFGMGIHYCLGSALARCEAEVALAALVPRLHALELGGERLEYPPDLTFHGPVSLPVSWV